MVKTIFIFALALFITLFTMWKVEATPSVPEVGQLIRPPYVIQYQQANHAVFDYGGLEFLFVVTRMPTPFPQCNDPSGSRTHVTGVRGRKLLTIISLVEPQVFH